MLAEADALSLALAASRRDAAVRLASEGSEGASASAAGIGSEGGQGCVVAFHPGLKWCCFHSKFHIMKLIIQNMMSKLSRIVNKAGESQ